jgi:lipid-binding SYLF domain-containing protein
LIDVLREFAKSKTTTLTNNEPKAQTTRHASFAHHEGDAEIISYSRSRGIFAGISLAGSTLRADNGANKNAYGKQVSAQAIVFHKAEPVPACAKDLLANIAESQSCKQKQKLILLSRFRIPKALSSRNRTKESAASLVRLRD